MTGVPLPSMPELAVAMGLGASYSVSFTSQPCSEPRFFWQREKTGSAPWR